MYFINKRALAFCCAAVVYSAAAAVVMYKRKTKRIRRFKVRPMNRNRETEGLFFTLVRDMKALEWDFEQYFKYTRMTPDLFQYLLSLVGPSLQKDPTKKPLSPEHRLMMTVHYLAEGCSMQEIAWGYRVGKATVHVIIKETCQILWNVLAVSQLETPTQQRWERISNEFFKRWNMPNCVGAVDGKHVVIQAPYKSGSNFFNYKKSFSIVLMAVCDAYYKFTVLDIGAFGANHDSVVFKNSGFGMALLNGQLNIPPPRYIPRTNVKCDNFVVGDAAFPLHTNLMRPYPGTHLQEKKKIFNYRLSRARRTIENTFGILCQRWRILRKPIVASVDICESIVQATVVLHNFLQSSEEDLPTTERRYCPTGYVDWVDENGLLHLGRWRDDGFTLRSVARIGSNNFTRAAQTARDTLADYFVSPVGCVPWQESYVTRGSVPL